MKLLIILAAIVVIYLLFCIRSADPAVPPAPENGGSFVWNQDSLWTSLERQYARARRLGCSAEITEHIETTTNALVEGIDRLASERLAPEDPHWDMLQHEFFDLGPEIAVCPKYVTDYLDLFSSLRARTKEQSVSWDLTDRAARDRLYRVLYGGRGAVEEVMLQHPDSIEALRLEKAEPSATPSAVIQGVTIHSGDILVSRGGYPTSALISRGNDYPGNFSHIAFVHVDDQTGTASVIESHIAVGVAIATVEKYLADKKLRIVVLRPRADLPEIVADPMLPHKAAEMALQRAREKHTPYDFEMNYQDPTKMFCSEVASGPFSELGLDLWMGISTISKLGLRTWLSSFGVKYFETQEPSDLEYDPQLTVVAEWRDAESLFRDHIDNAIIDARLEQAELGATLRYPWYLLGAARLAKAVSWGLNRIGQRGPVPEGMNSVSALRSFFFTQDHNKIVDQMMVEINAFRERNGYPPPYWQLLGFARDLV